MTLGSEYTAVALAILGVCEAAILATAASSACVAAPAEKVQPVTTLRGHRLPVTGVAFSPDGQRLVSGSFDTTAKVWDVQTGRELFTAPGHPGGVISVASSPDGQQFLAGCREGENHGKLWDAQTGRLLKDIPPSLAPPSRDWVESEALRPTPKPRFRGGSVESVAFSPDGKRVLAGAHEGRVLVWNAADGELVLDLHGHGDSIVYAAAFSPDGLLMVTAGYDSKIKLWSAQDGRALQALPGYTSAIASLAFFPDSGRILLANYNKTTRIWDLKAGREVLVLRERQDGVQCVAVSPSGRRVVTGGAETAVWDAEDGRELFALGGAASWLASVAFSPDGRKVAGGNGKGTIDIWDVGPEELSKTCAIGGAFTEVRLESEYLPIAARVAGDFGRGEIHGVAIRGRIPEKGDGAAEILLDTRRAELNQFGDVVGRTGPEPTRTSVLLRHAGTAEGGGSARDLALRESPGSLGFRRYELAFPGGLLEGRFVLVLGTKNRGPHRLLIYANEPPKDGRVPRAPSHIIPLHGLPSVTSALPELQPGPHIDLKGYYTTLDGHIRSLTIEGETNDLAKVVFDPNTIRFDAYGEPVMSTAIGPPRFEVTLNPVQISDPLRQGRRLFIAVPKALQNTNRVSVVLGPKESGPHRMLLYRGKEIQYIIPVFRPVPWRRE